MLIHPFLPLRCGKMMVWFIFICNGICIANIKFESLPCLVINLFVYLLFLDGRLSYNYVWYKTIISGYVIAAYLFSHLNYIWQDVKICSSFTPNATDEHVNSNENTSLQDNSSLDTHSKWPYYWIYFTNWCFDLFTVTLIVDNSLVIRRYVKENKTFDNVVDLENW